MICGFWGKDKMLFCVKCINLRIYGGNDIGLEFVRLEFSSVLTPIVHVLIYEENK